MRHCLEVCANETPTISPQRTRKRSNGSQLAIGARWSILLRFTELLLFTTRNDTHHRRQNEAFQELLSLNVHIPSGPFGNRVLFEGCNFRSRSTASCRTITQAHIQRLKCGKTECQLEAPVRPMSGYNAVKAPTDFFLCVRNFLPSDSRIFASSFRKSKSVARPNVGRDYLKCATVCGSDHFNFLSAICAWWKSMTANFSSIE